MKISSACRRACQGLLNALLVISLLFLSACAPGPQAAEFTQTPTLIPANTPTAAPSQDPALVALPTFSFDSNTPNTPIPFPTSSPFPTATLNVPTLGPGTPETECFVTASQEGIQLEKGPYYSSYRLLPKMEPGVIYQAIDIHEQFYQLARDGIPAGWVKYLDVFPTEGLSTEGPGCDRIFARPVSRPLTDFPGLCFFVVDIAAETFRDRELTKPAGPVLQSSSGPFVVLWKSRKSLFTLLSHAGPSWHVPADKVSTFGDCAGIPTSATVTTAGWLWSEPDEQRGEKLLRLTVGQSLHIEGDRPPDSSEEAAWVQAVVEQQNESISGWVWSALLSFD